MVDWNSIDWNAIVQAILFALFAAGTAILNVIIQPTYNNLVVPELSAPSLYPSLAHPGAGEGFLAVAVRFSDFLVTNLVDPSVALVLVGVAALYLVRSFSYRVGVGMESLLPRLVVAILGANFTIPILAALLDVGGDAFHLLSGFDGGAWRNWGNLVPLGGAVFSWDNGVLAFVVSFALFSMVLALATVVALRDAMIAVLVVLLPLFTLLWALPPLAALARRGWSLLVELAFVPAVMLVPLELAVGSSSILLVLAYLSIAVGSPYLVSLSRAQLGGMGFPSAGATLTGGLQRGLVVASLTSQGTTNSLATASSSTGRAAQVGSAVRSVANQFGKAPLPGGIALGAGHAVAQGSRQLIRHFQHPTPATPPVPGHPARTGASPSAPARTRP